MASARTDPKPPKCRIEYENLDMQPRYVEGVQGVPTPRGSVQCYLFSDYVIPPETIVPKTRRLSKNIVNIEIQDPYGLQCDQVRIVRRVEANVILSEAAARELHRWLGEYLEQMAINEMGITAQVQEK